MIADAAISVVAESGLRALTHRSIDVALGLPQGSTSYYYRTRAELVNAVIARIGATSRQAFEDAFGRSADSPADVSVRYLQHLITERSQQLRARHALMMDPGVDDEARTALGTCLFSVERAVELFHDRPVADGFISLCEGLLVAGIQRGATAAALRIPIDTYLRGADLPTADLPTADLPTAKRQ